MKVSSSAGQLAGWVHHHTFFRAYQPNQISLRHHFTATYTGALRNMLWFASAFCCHLYLLGLVSSWLPILVPFAFIFMLIADDRFIFFGVVLHSITLFLLAFALLALLELACFFFFRR